MARPTFICSSETTVNATGAIAGTLSTSGLAKVGALRVRARNLTGSMSIAIEDTAVGQLSAPGTVTPSTATTGGTLAAGTYFYKVTALDGTGETLPSPEASQVTTGSTSTVTLNWTAVPGAVSYNIYRGTSTGGENKQFNSLTNSFTDTGAAGTTVTPPASNTTGNGFSDAQTVCVFDIAAGQSPDGDTFTKIIPYETPDIRFGASLNQLRLNVKHLSNGASAIVLGWLEQ